MLDYRVSVQEPTMKVAEDLLRKAVLVFELPCCSPQVWACDTCSLP